MSAIRARLIIYVVVCLAGPRIARAAPPTPKDVDDAIKKGVASL